MMPYCLVCRYVAKCPRSDCIETHRATLCESGGFGKTFPETCLRSNEGVLMIRPYLSDGTGKFVIVRKVPNKKWLLGGSSRGGWGMFQWLTLQYR